jgi:DNA-binding transcriptional MocR family regulator
MLYQQIVDFITEQIDKGTIVPGEKLPSLRRMADQFDVSLSTAVEAYRKLELFGYVEARDRSAYRARLPLSSDSTLRPSKKFQSRVAQIEHIDQIIDLFNQSKDKNTAPFGVGTPALEKFPFRLLNRYMAQTLKHQPLCAVGYIFGNGLEELRGALSKWIRPWVGVQGSDNMIITNGCLEAVNISLASECEAGDLVAIESPCYFGLLHAIHHHQLKAIEVKTHPTEGLDPDSLEKLAKEHKIKVLISSANGQNPLGYTMSDENKKRVLRICKKYNIRLIEDDLYGEICYQDKRPKTYKYFDKDNIVTYCSSFSKFLGPGLRIGWCIPAKNSQNYIRHKLSLNLSTTSISQHVAYSILKNEDVLKLGQSFSDYYQRNIQIYSNVLENYLGDKVSLSRPSGSYFLWVRIEGLDTVSIFEKVKKAKLSYTPGPYFSATYQFREYLRINCAHEFTEERHQQLIKLCELFLKELR